mgnify:CR=1 FL=1
MKKIIGVAAFAVLGMVALSSCKKDWTCSCLVNGADAGSVTIEDETKNNAKDECDEGDTSISIFGTTLVTECEIN